MAGSFALRRRADAAELTGPLDVVAQMHCRLSRISTLDTVNEMMK